ncbi:acyl-CoA dehydrogenase [Nocardioides daedukensis]|uniref:Acyl-CoA dehydrogenase n=1 Tax=Nocardioides daedukensis TaxID=634462 RepID=A0A7Y9UTB7_9ACTN|nr:acyl-CoA dehydrogenase family protein [Nocardioides daedukensis]NYG57779.1 acyl-CoA dehydrogenase [Nocardioides daedukensis]
MDFTFTPEQEDAAALAAGILADKTTPERMRAVEKAGDRFDRDLWQALGDAGLLSLAVPEEYDGAGLGLIELSRVLIEVGRKVAPVPLATHGPAALVLAEFGTDAQKQEWLPRAATGEAVLSTALTEELEHLPATPGVTLVDGVLNGTKTLVRAGTVADLLLVTASTPTGTVVALVRPGDPGVTVSAQRTSDGDTTALVQLDGVPVGADRILGEADGGADGGAATRLAQVATAAACAELAGVVHGAVRLTADYAKTREQFGRPIGSFQAVAQRLADGYIDSLFQELTLWQAVWRLTEGLPTTTELAIAKMWAADAAHKVAHTTVHVHGGVGIDLDGEAHRYFTAAKRFEFSFGGTTEQSLAIGRALAAR